MNVQVVGSLKVMTAKEAAKTLRAMSEKLTPLEKLAAKKYIEAVSRLVVAVEAI